jgi:hypothetical protein
MVRSARLLVAQSTLRMRGGININIKHIPHNQRYGYSVTGSYHAGDAGVLRPYTFTTFATYEEALEDALLACTELVDGTVAEALTALVDA